MHKSEAEYKILKILERNPKLTQRQVADELEISLGKTHYVIRALVDKGLVKLENFKNSTSSLEKSSSSMRIYRYLCYQHIARLHYLIALFYSF